VAGSFAHLHVHTEYWMALMADLKALLGPAAVGA
jgi:hypothetical protein